MEILEQKYRALLGEAGRRYEPDTGNMRACFELLALAAAIDRDCAGRLARHRLSEGKFVLIFLLHGQPQGLSPHELADRAGVTRATITGLLDGLERDGFVERGAGLDDRRKITVRLTHKGQETAGLVCNEHAQWIASLFAGLDAKEKHLLSGLLYRVWKNTRAGGSRAG